MGEVSDRLATLGLALPAVTAPLAAYVPAVLDGDLVFSSGQLPLVDGKLSDTGKVGEAAGLIRVERAAELAQVCALNALAAVASVLAGPDGLDQVRVLKVVGFVASDPGFTEQHRVLNGASALIGDVLGDRGVHARSAVGVNALPLDAPVEVELIVRILGQPMGP
ncbi:MAG: RidA family protein [Nostocoides sp.]